MNIGALLERNAARLDALYAGADQSARYAALARAFEAHFGRAPEKFISAPGRTEVVGNHTDHNHGRVLAGSVNLDSAGGRRGERHERRAPLFRGLPHGI